MGRIFLTTLFMAVLLLWLRYEFKHKVSIKQYWPWFAGALLVQIIASIISIHTTDRVIGNLLYHGIGGGAACVLLYVYLLKTYSVKLSWRVEVVALFAFVSSLGVINELAEYAGEMAGRSGYFSWDSHDTWRDLTANTVGSITAWLVYRLVLAVAKSRGKS